MDHIVIDRLRIDTTVGVYEWERAVRQTLWLDLELACDTKPAAARDDLADSIDYANLASRIEAFAIAHHFSLIETLAEKIAMLIINDFAVQAVKVYLRKPDALAGAASAGVRIERSR